VIDSKGTLAESAHEHVGDRKVVLDHEEPHGGAGKGYEELSMG
jgi:hypothetical protein